MTVFGETDSVGLSGSTVGTGGKRCFASFSFKISSSTNFGVGGSSSEMVSWKCFSTVAFMVKFKAEQPTSKLVGRRAVARVITNF